MSHEELAICGVLLLTAVMVVRWHLMFLKMNKGHEHDKTE